MSDDPGRPSWMDGSKPVTKETSGARHQPGTYIKSDLSHLGGSSHQQAQSPTCHPPDNSSIVAGIVIIAWLAMLSTFFGAGALVINLISPPDFGEWTSWWRFLLACAFAVAASAVTWKAVKATVS